MKILPPHRRAAAKRQTKIRRGYRICLIDVDRSTADEECPLNINAPYNIARLISSEKGGLKRFIGELHKLFSTGA